MVRRIDGEAADTPHRGSKAMHQLRRLARSRAGLLGLVSLGVVVAVTVTAWATTVTPRGAAFTATNVTNVTFVTNTTPESVIVCTRVTIGDTTPNEVTNGNAGGSVITEVPSTSSSYIASFGGCTLNGRPLSGGAEGIMTFSWNIIGGVPLVTLAMPRRAFHFYDTFGCEITVGRFPVQSVVGRWTNGTGAPSRAIFTNQNIVADSTGCGIPAFTYVKFSGTFNVSEISRPVVVAIP
jgi:hypothetical protein